MPSPDLIHVLIVDDSRIFRSELETAFAEIPGTLVVGSVFSGEKAIEFLDKNHVDLITLDIAMPGMSGIECLRKIRERKFLGRTGRRVEALLLSAMTTQGARCTVEGLELGAYDYLLKPEGPSQTENRSLLRKHLAEKLRPLRDRSGNAVLAKLLQSVRAKESGAQISGSDNPIPLNKAMAPRRPSSDVQAIVIGASTGGPEALASLLPALASQTKVPIFIVQHNLQNFNEYLGESLSRRLPRKVVVPDRKLEVVGGEVYLAKGGQHMLVSKVGDGVFVQLSDAPPENQFKPSVDVLFRSASTCYGKGLVSVVLTGMLNDGAQGAGVIKRSGGMVIAQDEATSVVWGMPRAAIEAGVVDWVLPLHEIGPALLKFVSSSSNTLASTDRA
jgi:two-component system, chemotaxis family, protein-glutamate methylesterase/glutaminase